MKTTLRIPLTTNAVQHARLSQLQSAFAGVCNAIAPTVQQNKGSKMVCNAIYSISRTCRMVFQNPQSPFSLARLGSKPLPLLRFSDNCPVYFDRHTLSVKKGQLSMYTLDGRLRFALALSPENEADFATKKLREIVLSRRPDAMFELVFQFDDEPAKSATHSKLTADSEYPEYVMIEDAQ